MKNVDDFLDQFIKNKRDSGWLQPEIFKLNNDDDKTHLIGLFENNKVNNVFDSIDFAGSELYDIANPSKKDSKSSEDLIGFKEILFGENPRIYGQWVYYPWSGNLVHFPEKDHLRALRTSRNQNLISADEQKELYESTVLVIGLSVGSSAVEMLLSQGIGGKLILVDMDIIEPSNLNRIKTTYLEVGTHKVDMLAKRISETDPYIEQVHYKNGLNDENIDEILRNYHPDVIIDEMDDLSMKLKLRAKAKEYDIAVLMATDDGENAILDIERYDTNKEQQPFDGRLPEQVIHKILAGELSRPEIGMLIGKYFVGGEHIPLRMFESLVEVGRTIPSWPQLAGAATLSGVSLAYAAKKIILNQDLHPGRHIFDMDKELDPTVATEEYQQQVRSYQAKFFV